MANRLLIKIVKHTLTDSSEVFNVLLMDAEDKQAIDFPALNERSAQTFADALCKLIEEHTLVTDIWTG